VIDDNEYICADITKLLGDRQFKVVTARNGKIGLELAQEF
jgi:response regulator RpfG family c-di-GMP phosphodiesterase